MLFRRCFVIIGLLLIAAGTNATAQKLPFPQHVHYTAGAIKPAVPQAELDKATETFYLAWKSKYLIHGCRPDQYYVSYAIDSPDKLEPTNAVTVSEAHGYGMVITALMAGYDPDSKIYFDGLYRFYTNHFSSITPYLMGWQEVSPTCAFAPGGDDSATDGDLDIAYSLFLAHRQWGSSGEINYLAEAKKAIAAVMRGDINTNNWSVLLGDWATPEDKKSYYKTRPSDSQPSQDA